MESDEIAAQLAAIRAEVRALRTDKAQAGGLTVFQGYEAFEKAMKSSHSWRMTVAKLRPMIRRLGHMFAVDVTPKVWAKHHEARQGELIERGRNKGQPPSAATLNVELGVAKGFLEWLASDERELIPFNPLRRAKYRAKVKPRRSWPRPELFQQLLGSPKPDGLEQRAVFHGWLYVMYETGLRNDEARCVRRDRMRLTEDGVALDVDTTKGGEPHTVGVTVDALAALAAIPPVLGSPFYFARSLTKRLYGKRIFHYWFRNACEAIGLDAHVVAGEIQFRPHDCRRAAATNLIDRGGDVRDAQRLLKHASIQTTEGYIQQTATSAIKIARIMERRSPHHAATNPHEKDSRQSDGVTARRT